MHCMNPHASPGDATAYSLDPTVPLPEGQSKFCFKIYCCPAFRHFVPPFFIVFLCTNLTLKYLSFIENHVSSVENHVKALPMVRFVAKQQFICQALGVVARI